MAIYRSAPTWSTTLAGDITSTSTTIPLSSVTNLINGNYYIITIDRVDGNGNDTPAKKEVIKGQLSGTNLINCTRGVEGTAQEHLSGATVEMIFTSSHWEELMDFLETEHNSDGTHGNASSITLNQQSTPPEAVAGKDVLYADTSDNLKYVKSSGDVNEIISSATTTITSSATPTPTGDRKKNELFITALSENATIQAPSGTASNGNVLLIRIKDNGTVRSLLFNSIYRFSSDLEAPTTTTAGKTMYLGFVYNSADTKWDCVAILNNF